MIDAKYFICVSQDEKYLIFNKINGKIGILGKEEYDELWSANSKSVEENPDFFSIDIPIVDANSHKKVFGITFEVTTNCNLNCQYCYQKDKFVRGDMADEIIDKSLLYIKKVYEKNKFETMIIRFIGGEPLLKKDVIRKIYHGILKEKQLKYVKKFVHIDTNGTIPLQDMYEEISNLHMSITLSSERDHNKKRGSNRFNSFRTIVENITGIRNMPSGSSLDIRYNTDNENYEEFEDFLEFVRQKLINVSTVETAYIDNYEYNAYRNTLDRNFYKKWNSTNAVDSLVKRGFIITRHFNEILAPCMAYQPFSCKIYADGRVTVCDSMLHDESDISIYDIVEDIDLVNKYFSDLKAYQPLWDDCRDCSEVVQCGGKRFCRETFCDYNEDIDLKEFLKRYLFYYEQGKGELFINI